MRTQDKDVKGLGRVVHGQVSASGGIVSGTGFTIAKTGTGAYTLTFLQPFDAVPDIVITGKRDLSGPIPSLQNLTPGSVGIVMVNDSATAADCGWFFHATEADPA